MNWWNIKKYLTCNRSDEFKHFKIDEFGCKDGTSYPKEWIGSRLNQLRRQLNIIREYFGDRPITITSAYRTEEYNKKVGGVKNSMHVQGMAVDIKIKGVSPRKVADGIRNLIKQGKILQGGVGDYSSFTHYDIRGKAARWKK